MLQNIIGVSVTYLFGIAPLNDMVMGTASFKGGHGAITAYGTTTEEMGVNGALSMGLASETLG